MKEYKLRMNNLSSTTSSTLNLKPDREQVTLPVLASVYPLSYEWEKLLVLECYTCPVS